MNTEHFRITYILCIAIATLLIAAGCASTGVDLVKKGVITLEHLPSKYAHTHKVSVHQTQADIVISGELYDRFHQRGFIPGHVDIEILSPEDKILGQGISKYHRVGVGKSRKFELIIRPSVTVPQGSKIRIIHHPASLLEQRILRHPSP